MAAGDFKISIKARLSAIESEIMGLEMEREGLRVQLAEFESAVASSRTTAAPDTLLKWSDGTQHTQFDTRLLQSAKDLFGIEKFRPLQLPVMRAVMAGNDAVAVMPTGSGKSLLYQIPATLLPGVALVVSPLRSLMRDQTQQLVAAGVPAAFLAAGQDRSHATAVYASMLGKGAVPQMGGSKRARSEGGGPPDSPPLQLKVLFVTPERIAKSKLLKSKLEAVHKAGLLSLLVVDEVHCVSQWGHDFRPDFKHLSVLKMQFPSTPCLGLTATASDQVLQDVQGMLRMNDCQVFRTSVRRPNLFLEVQRKANTATAVAEQVAGIVQDAAGGAGIVYCLSRKDAEATTAALLERGFAAGCYHAWLSDEQRESVHDAWAQGSLQVICATVAFGMGINMLHVRFVIHHSMPKSVEGYSQEAGRAGRDGQPARCVLLYHAGDVFRQSIMAYSEKSGLAKLYAMAEYAQATPHKLLAPSAAGGGGGVSEAQRKASLARDGRHARLAAAFGEDPVLGCPFGPAGLAKDDFPMWCGCDVLMGRTAGLEPGQGGNPPHQRDVSHLAAYVAVAVACLCAKADAGECSAANGVFCGAACDLPNRMSSSSGAPGLTLKQLLTEFHKWDRKQHKGGFNLQHLQREWRGVQKHAGGSGSASVETDHKPTARIGQALDSCGWEQLMVALLLRGVLKEAFAWTAYSTISYLTIGSRHQMKQLCSGKLQICMASVNEQAASPGLYQQWCAGWARRNGAKWSELQVATQAVPEAAAIQATVQQGGAMHAAVYSGSSSAAGAAAAVPRASPGPPTKVVELLSSSDSEDD